MSDSCSELEITDFFDLVWDRLAIPAHFGIWHDHMSNVLEYQIGITAKTLACQMCPNAKCVPAIIEGTKTPNGVCNGVRNGAIGNGQFSFECLLGFNLVPNQ